MTVPRCLRLACLLCCLVLPAAAQTPAPEGTANPALARQFAQGVAAYDAGNYARAFELWLPLAQNGDLAAQRNVAHMLRRGLGVETDLARALDFYRRSAEFGFVTAQVNLAAMLLAGEGTDPDPEEAALWFDRAARGGHPLAQYNLGVLYETGQGVEADMARAMGWYAAAAQGGSQPALDRLAELVMTLPGPGTDAPDAIEAGQETAPAPAPPGTAEADESPDTEEAADASGPAETAGTAETAAPRTPPGFAAVSPAQAERFVAAAEAYAAGDFATALSGFEGLAYAGIGEAQYRLARMRNRGEGEPRDPVAALAWWMLAEDRGHAAAARAAAALRAELDARQRAEAAREAAAFEALIAQLAGDAPGAPLAAAPARGETTR